MKEFAIKFKRNTSIEEVKECLTSKNSYSCDIVVSELPSPPEVKKIETGVLMSPSEICKDAEIIHFSRISLRCTDSNIGDRMVLNDHIYPRQCYRDIRTEWDFGSIPPNALIEVTFNDECIAYGKYVSVTEHLLFLSHCDQWEDDDYNRHSIKSIRIIESGSGEAK